MEKKITIMAIILLVVMAESKGQRPASQNDVITVDVRKSYSSKKELILQDFMDVEYVALETNDNFVNQGVVLDIGKKIILVKNRVNDGDIFIYDRQGKAIRKINRKGQGGEEYTNISNITLDEDNGEMFVNDIFTRKIFVYDLYGKFKRSFRHKEDTKAYGYRDIFNYDRDNLICYDQFNEKVAFVLISKKDGSITKEIETPFKKKIILAKTSVNEANVPVAMGPGPYRPIIPFKGKWILLEPSSDIVYSLLPNYSLQPFIERTPSIQSMDPEVAFLLRVISDRYYFMETVRNEFNFSTGTGFAKTYMVYDKQEKNFFGYAVYNGDFTTKKEIYMSSASPVNHEIESWYPLEAYQLVESYKKGELKGKLKEIAAKLDEDDNPVIMLIKHRK